MRAWLAMLLVLSGAPAASPARAAEPAALHQVPTGSEVSQWISAPSDGVSLNLANDGGALRMDFDFHGHGGWAAARRPVNIDVPENFRFVFRLRGEMQP